MILRDELELILLRYKANYYHVPDKYLTNCAPGQRIPGQSNEVGAINAILSFISEKPRRTK